MKIEKNHRYKPYEFPRNGLFSIHTGVWLPSGWENKKEARLIIGETDDSYVCKLLHTDIPEWVGNVVQSRNTIIPIGIHKSRFIRWIPTQTSLFI